MSVNLRCLKDTLEVGRFIIPYRIYEGRGPHIVCINGVQQSMAMWHSLVRRFAPDYRIVIFDFPNQGRAKFISGPKQVSLDEQVEILRAIMDQAGVSPDATLCTASWGGVVAIAFAAKYGNRIKRLILASLGEKPNKNMIETIKKGASLDINDRKEMANVLIKSFGEDLPQNIKQKITQQFCAMKEEDLRAFYQHGSFVISSKNLSSQIDLKAIKTKTILVNGEKDKIIDLEDVRYLASQIPDCSMRVIKGVGHFLHMEREEVLDIYQEILSSP